MGRRSALAKMPEEFQPLATYNGEVARGLIHTPEWRDAMAELQHRFNVWVRGVELSEFYARG